MPLIKQHFSFEVTGKTSEHNTTCPLAFDVLEFELEESLNECFRLHVDLTSFDPALDFSLIIDQPATFTIWQDGVAVRHVHGLISDFYQGKTGFHRTRYVAVVEPRLARLGLVSDWRIFQQKTTVDILSAVLDANHIQHFSINAQHQHLAREYCVQPGVTDFHFLQRLAAEEGFVYRFAMDADQHQLVFTDAITSFGALGAKRSNTQDQQGDQSSSTPAASILYNPTPGGDQPTPALHSFIYAQHVRTTLQTQRDYTFKNPRYQQQHGAYSKNASSILSGGDGYDGQAGQSSLERYERYDYPGRYKQDDAGGPFTQTRIASLRGDAVVATAIGNDARIEPGLTFSLRGHPRSDLNTHWRAVRITHKGVQHTAAEEEAASATVSTRYEQTAELVPAHFEWKARIVPKHVISGPLIAHVTGPGGEEIYTDEYGRVKVQFPWDRYNGSDEHSSCWIRVAQNWAGAGWGHMALPRVGQEVIVDFLDGDQDQPIVIGRTYDATHPTPYKLPALKAQETTKSKEHKGSGFNELLMDDTTGEIKAQLHSTHGATQLTLGYLTHPRRSDGSGEHRGDGFELRTDEWGAIRAGKGVYISADSRSNAQGMQLDMEEAIGQLEAALEIAQALKKSGDRAQAITADTSTQEEQLETTFKELTQAGILMSAPQGVGVATPKSIQMSAQENVTVTSARNTDVSAFESITLSAKESVSLFSAQEEMKLVAGQERIRVQANDNNVELFANKMMQIVSTEDRVEIAAEKEILLTSGGGYIRIADGNIYIHTPGVIEHKAASFPYLGPTSMNYSMPNLPDPKGNYNLKHHFTDDDGIPYANIEYVALFSDGSIRTGQTDNEGFTETFYSDESVEIAVHLLI